MYSHSLCPANGADYSNIRIYVGSRQKLTLTSVTKPAVHERISLKRHSLSWNDFCNMPLYGGRATARDGGDGSSCGACLLIFATFSLVLTGLYVIKPGTFCNLNVQPMWENRLFCAPSYCACFGACALPAYACMSACLEKDGSCV